MDEPQPIDPKEASRIIQKQIRKKKTAMQVEKPDTAARAAAGGQAAMSARALTGDDIVDLMQRTPERLCLAWIRLHDEGRPLRAKQVSRAEIGLIVGSGSS